MTNKVSVYSVKSYDAELVFSAVKKIFDDFGGVEKLLKKGNKVVIKPNLVVKKKPDVCATTHPSVLEAVIRLFKEKGADINVAECSGGPNTPALLNGIYRETGISEVLKKYSVPYVVDMIPVKIHPETPLSCPEIEVLRDFVECDVFINLAKMKTHSLTLHTGAAKNLYGTIPGLKKVEYHSRFPEVRDFAGLIIDLNNTIPPAFSITDGIWGMEKDGPSGGVPKFAGVLMGSENAWALDFASCDFMGLDKNECPILARAEEEGLFNGYQTIGDDFDSLKPAPFLLPDSKKPSAFGFFIKFCGTRFNKIIAPHPVIDTDKCIGCGECAMLCPQKTITVKNKKAYINKKNCIRCWCCQEMCPQKAVKSKGLFILQK